MILSLFPLSLREVGQPWWRWLVLPFWPHSPGDVAPAEGLVGVELLSDGAGEEGALVLEPVPGPAALLERQAVSASRDLREKKFGLL